MENRSAAFQEIITVPLQCLANKPSCISSEEAASLPVCHVTAAAAIAAGLQISLPHLGPTGSRSLKSVLVLGESSAVGAAATQLLRQALPGAVIPATSSIQHHSLLMSLGAAQCFERFVQESPSPIRAATPDGSGVDTIIDTVGAAAHHPTLFAALNPGGPKLYSDVATGIPGNSFRWDQRKNGFRSAAFRCARKSKGYASTRGISGNRTVSAPGAG
ncbi:hypothetical protein BJX76DRAFT_163446 [Aspergillus varians]